MNTILEVHKKYNALVLVAFNNDSGFVAALDKACGRFINSNSVTRAANSSSKSPELLAKYCDLLLKKSSKNPEEAELEDTLNQVVSVRDSSTCFSILLHCRLRAVGFRLDLNLILCALLADGSVQIHRGQGCIPEVLQQNAGEALGAAHVCQRRRRGFHDLQIETGLRIRVHFEVTTHVPGTVMRTLRPQVY